MDPVAEQIVRGLSFLTYMSQDKKIGEIISKDASEVKRIRKNLEKNIPALVKLKENIATLRQRGLRD